MFLDQIKRQKKAFFIVLFWLFAILYLRNKTINEVNIMCQVKRESIELLCRMAERRCDNSMIPLDKIHQYTAVIKHCSNIHRIDVSVLKSTFSYINVDVFNEYPTLKSEVVAAKERIELFSV